MTSVLFKSCGPKNGLAMAFPGAMNRVPFGFPYGPSSRVSNNGGPKPSNGVSHTGNTLCPFKCKLDCAAFRCSSLGVSPTVVAPGRGTCIAYGIAGAKGQSKSRIVRLCMHSMLDDIAACRGGLIKFRQMRLGPNRAGRVAFPVSHGTLRLLGTSVR